MRAEAGDIRTALSNQEQAATLFREAGDWRGEAVGRNNIGGMLDVLGDPLNALDSYRRSLALATVGDDHAHKLSCSITWAKSKPISETGRTHSATTSKRWPWSDNAGNIQKRGASSAQYRHAYRAPGQFPGSVRSVRTGPALRRAAGDKRGRSRDAQGRFANAHRVRNTQRWECRTSNKHWRYTANSETNGMKPRMLDFSHGPSPRWAIGAKARNSSTRRFRSKPPSRIAAPPHWPSSLPAPSTPCPAIPPNPSRRPSKPSPNSARSATEIPKPTPSKPSPAPKATAPTSPNRAAAWKRPSP